LADSVSIPVDEARKPAMKKKKSDEMTDLTWKKKLLFSVLTLAATFLLLELCFRVFFAFYVGPSVLLYGTPFARKAVRVTPALLAQKAEPEAKTFMNKMTIEEWRQRRTVVTHPNELQGYSKYFPNQKRIDFDVETGERFNVTINKRGFRGRDFSDQKEPGVIRIICLGASSTFGYFDRDDETYPVYLEQLLNKKYAGRVKFEVINFGIPHLTATQIYNLFVMEGIPLHPDIVTFYEGNNDSEPPRRWLDESLLHAAIKKIGRVLITARFVDSVSSKYLKQSLSEQAVADISNNFINQVSKINQECRKRGILFIVANQQKNSQAFDRAMLKKLTYQQEVEKIQAKLEQSDALIHPELQLLIHSVLMKNLRSWAKANQVPFVDVIARLDHDRDVLVSWVHLSPEGNRMVAEAFAEKIFEYNWATQTSNVQDMEH
jgi:lysophospholipase L1-like esterase